MKRLSQFKKALVELLTVALLVQPVSAFGANTAVATSVSNNGVSNNAVSDNDTTAPVVTPAPTTPAPAVAAVKDGKLNKGIKISALNGDYALTVTAKTKVCIEGEFKADIKDTVLAKAAKARYNKKHNLTAIVPKVSKKTGNSYVVKYTSGYSTVTLTVVNPAANFKAYKKITLATVSFPDGKQVGAVSSANGVETIKISVFDANTSALNGTGVAGNSGYNKVDWSKTSVKGGKYEVVDNGAAIIITPEAGKKGAAKVKVAINGKKYSTGVKFINKLPKASKVNKQNELRSDLATALAK